MGCNSGSVICAHFWGRILELFTGDLILRGTFEKQILPNSKKLRIIMQCALLDIHFIILLEELTYAEFLRTIYSMFFKSSSQDKISLKSFENFKGDLIYLKKRTTIDHALYKLRTSANCGQVTRITCIFS